MTNDGPNSHAGQETTPRIVINLKDLKVSTISSGTTTTRGRGRGSRGGRRGRGFRGGRGSRNLGDRDLEEIVEKGEEEDFLEEHVILRVPPDLAQDIREHIKDKEKIQEVNLIFTDPRCGTFTFKDKKYDTKLVDLPTILESQKIFNNKQMVKIADISQMLVVDCPENQASRQTKQLLSYAWPDGITPPLKDVRRRRFRKRVSKQIIEIVENELERLLLKDLQALDVVYEYADAPDREDSDSDNDPDSITQDAGTSTNKARKDTESLGGEELITEADFDNCSENELLTLEELERAIEIRDPDEQPAEAEEEDGDNEGMEDDDEDANESEDSDSEVDEEALEQKAVLKEGILELETNLQKKRADLAVATNPIIKKRFEDIISKLNLELELKQAQLEALEN